MVVYYWWIDAIWCNLRLDAIEIENWRALRNSSASRNCVLWRLGLWPTLGFDKDLETKPHCFSMLPKNHMTWIPDFTRNRSRPWWTIFAAAVQLLPTVAKISRTVTLWLHARVSLVSLTRPKLPSRPTNIICEWIWHDEILTIWFRHQISCSFPNWSSLVKLTRRAGIPCDHGCTPAIIAGTHAAGERSGARSAKEWISKKFQEDLIRFFFGLDLAFDARLANSRLTQALFGGVVSSWAPWPVSSHSDGPGELHCCQGMSLYKIIQMYYTCFYVGSMALSSVSPVSGSCPVRPDGPGPGIFAWEGDDWHVASETELHVEVCWNVPECGAAQHFLWCPMVQPWLWDCQGGKVQHDQHFFLWSCVCACMFPFGTFSHKQSLCHRWISPLSGRFLREA